MCGKEAQPFLHYCRQRHTQNIPLPGRQTKNYSIDMFEVYCSIAKCTAQYFSCIFINNVCYIFN